MAVDPGEVSFSDVRDLAERTFHQIAETKGIAFTLDVGADLPPTLRTDGQRLQQVIKNLLSNAFKFTPKGSVSLMIRRVSSGWSADHAVLDEAHTVVAFAVKDTGIGIAKEKHKIIFEAFQQADGTTSRKYGGTGLGLSISREIARMLGGEIVLKSATGQGSTFTLFLPLNHSEPRKRPLGRSGMEGGSKTEAGVETPEGSGPRAASGSLGPAGARREVIEDEAHVDDDRFSVQTGDRVLLIVEDDLPFAKIMVDMARARGFKTLVAGNAERALTMVRDFKVDAITLDMRLPDRDGWSVLDRLKHDPKTRHIPVHIISVDDGRKRGLRLGAMTYLKKPVSKDLLDETLKNILDFVQCPQKKLLVVENDLTQRMNIVALIGNHDVKTSAVETGTEGLALLRGERFDCVVLDLDLPDMTGFQFLERISADPELHRVPVIVYTAKELSKSEETELRRVAESIVIKDVKSPDRLLDETALFLHRVHSDLPEPKQHMLAQVQHADATLAGRLLLVVDDDIRNIFALTAVLENYGLRVVYAENGADGIAMLTKTPGIELVLMDVMMPEMDGHQTMRAIRKIDKFKKLPIVALTAKAMKGDREKCIEAGATDYITKPVDTDQLMSLLRVWLYR